MSFKTVSYLYCDAPDCRFNEPYHNAPVEHGFVGATITEQRQHARRHGGWIHLDGKDYCGECAAQLKKGK